MTRFLPAAVVALTAMTAASAFAAEGPLASTRRIDLLRAEQAAGAVVDEPPVAIVEVGRQFVHARGLAPVADVATPTFFRGGLAANAVLALSEIADRPPGRTLNIVRDVVRADDASELADEATARPELPAGARANIVVDVVRY